MPPIRTRLAAHAALAALALVPALLPAQAADPRDDPQAMIARIEGRQTPDRQGYDALTLQELMGRFRVPAVSIAVIRDGKIHWARAYGVADVETGQAADTGTLFQAASISKPVFAMGVVRLAQEGRVSLDGDVNAHLTSWKVPASAHTRAQPVTLRSLLSHTSGADDGFGFPGYDPGAPTPTLVQLLNGERPSNVGPVRFARAPYAGYKYSGGGITLAQLAVEDVLKRPFADAMRDLVLAPIGMASSTFAQPLPEALAPRAARAHAPNGRRAGAPWHVYPEQAAAGLWTTPSDLARFAIEVQRALRGPKGAVLTQASAREMIAPTGTGEFAVGLGIAQRGQGWYFTHGGSNWGYRCNLVAHVRKGYGMVVMTNGELGAQVGAEVEARIAAAYGWDSLDKAIPR